MHPSSHGHRPRRSRLDHGELEIVDPRGSLAGQQRAYPEGDRTLGHLHDDLVTRPRRGAVEVRRLHVVEGELGPVGIIDAYPEPRVPVGDVAGLEPSTELHPACRGRCRRRGERQAASTPKPPASPERETQRSVFLSVGLGRIEADVVPLAAQVPGGGTVLEVLGEEAHRSGRCLGDRWRGARRPRDRRGRRDGSWRLSRRGARVRTARTVGTGRRAALFTERRYRRDGRGMGTTSTNSSEDRPRAAACSGRRGRPPSRSRTFPSWRSTACRLRAHGIGRPDRRSHRRRPTPPRSR